VDIKVWEPTTMMKVKGLCFFLAGNDARASVSLRGTALERAWNRALGNGAQTTVNVCLNSSVGMFEIATNGNGAKLIIQGEGAYTCPVGHPYIECTR
jgi:hypothetical protein